MKILWCIAVALNGYVVYHAVNVGEPFPATISSLFVLYFAWNYRRYWE